MVLYLLYCTLQDTGGSVPTAKARLAARVDEATVLQATVAEGLLFGALFRPSCHSSGRPCLGPAPHRSDRVFRNTTEPLTTLQIRSSGRGCSCGVIFYCFRFESCILSLVRYCTAARHAREEEGRNIVWSAPVASSQKA